MTRVLWYEGAGFALILALSWLNELSELPHIFGATHYIANWRESAMESLIVLAVAIPVMILTRRAVSRLYYLEGFLRVCAWCRKLEHDGEWVPVEEFFARKFETAATHGMCGTCLVEMRKKVKTPTAA